MLSLGKFIVFLPGLLASPKMLMRFFFQNPFSAILRQKSSDDHLARGGGGLRP